MPGDVSGEIKLKLITEGGVEGAAEGAAAPKDADKKSEQAQLQGMNKWLAGIGKVMKKISPVADLSGLIVYLLKKSAVLWSLIEAFLDIAGAFIDVILAPFVPIIVPVFKLLAAFIPLVQSFMKILQPTLDGIGALLEVIGILIKGVVDKVKGFFDKISSPGKSSVGLAQNVAKLGIPGGLIQFFKDMKRPKYGGAGKPGEMYQSGIKYVPNNLVAQLHRGEQVLTAREAQRRNSGMNIMNPQFNVTAGGSTTLDARVFARQLYKEFTTELARDSRRP